MTYDLSQFHQVFFDEAREHLDTMERLLLALDIAAPDPEDLNAVFRAAHSIKGGSGTFGFTDMAGITHVMESLLDRVRHNELPLSNDIIEAALHAGDVLANQLKCHRDGTESNPADAEPVILALTQLLNQQAVVPSQAVHSGTAVKHAPPDVIHRYQIEYQPGSTHAELNNVLLAELGRLGTVSASTNTDTSITYQLESSCKPAEIEDIFSFVANPQQYRITHSPVQNSAPDPTPAETAPADALIEGDGFGFFVAPEPIKASVEEDQGYGFFTDLPPIPADNTAAEIASKPKSSDQPEHPRQRASDKEADSSIRVSVEKVDQLINLIGELVITHAMLAQTISRFDPVQHEGLFDGMAQLERNSRDMQEAVMSIRMLPIGSVFSRFPRLVRDLASKLGKQVELKLIGENTELDKGLIEKLADPLTHLVRNSLDHGIETTEQRLAVGKQAKGILSLHAFHQGGNIIIEVIDDGAGLNRERIIAKATEQGIPVNPDAPDQEIWPLIFAPGFSTAEQVTDVSGRGVGMDVVKRNIEGMGGRVEITTQRGFGTCISIRLPLTLAILDGMSIGVGDQVFIVPLNMIVESLQPKPSEVSSVSGSGLLVHVRGDYLPVVPLHQVFNVEPRTRNPCEGIIVILEIGGDKAALLVDELLGQHQVVIKSLETNYRRVRGISGATIMGDGRVALILDVVALVQLSRS